MTQLAEFLFPAPAERRAGAIFSWWEKRRLAYNAWVGTAGAVTVAAGYLLFLLLPGGPGAPPLGLVWRPIVIFGVLANVFYTAGPVVEILAHKLFRRQLLPVGPALYRMGLTFSVGLALFPLLIMMIGWVISAVGQIF
ncbi:MAG TPA: hypothetical protein VJ997_10315 [Longimicrobiales bacterium]|nr:hypothetical protein [Longimicrobiales bacterium]